MTVQTTTEAMCDPETGVCLLPDHPAAGTDLAAAATATVRYVGDPMCSWCWGISPSVKALLAHCRERGLAFEIDLGGLRAGGGDAWNEAFRRFLQHEWARIRDVTGQPFSMRLLERAHYDYDTEPACRAVVILRTLVREEAEHTAKTLNFFSAIQRKFYVDGADPKEVAFYRSLCEDAGVDFAAFAAAFSSEAARRETAADFARCRAFGVRAFPTLLLQTDRGVSELGSGFVTAARLIDRLESALVA